jgi:hypothetical protein
MSLPELKKGFTNTAAAVGLTAIAAITPLSYSFADQTQPVRTVAASTVQSQAGAAQKWAHKAENRDGVSILISLGTQSRVTAAQAEEVLRKDFKKNGITKIAFFHEQNDAPATGFLFHYRMNTDGFFTIANVRDNVRPLANQVKFENPDQYAGLTAPERTLAVNN